MFSRPRVFAATLILLTLAPFAARAEDLRSTMEDANARFVEAFNRPSPKDFLGPDAILLFQVSPPQTGPEAIMKFWGSRIHAGARDHTFEIINAWGDGKYAFQLAKAGVQLILPSGEKRVISGYSVRIFERQDDGTWKAKVHMFNRQGNP